VVGHMPHQSFFYFFAGDDNMKPKHVDPNPMSEYLVKLQLIVSNTTFMDKEWARKYETAETKINGTAYTNAVLKKDIFESYNWSEQYLKRKLLDFGIRDEVVLRKLLLNHNLIPYDIRGKLLESAREERINEYKEPNRYYLNLTGNPLIGVDPIISVPHDFYMQHKGINMFDASQPIHQLNRKAQELLMNSPYWNSILEQYPDVEYIKHMGSYSIPIVTSRTANDGDILLINESKLYTVHDRLGVISVEPEIIHEFTTTYKRVRHYVYDILRGDFSQIYPNYNNFIRFLTIYMTIGQCMNEFMHKSTKLIYMNDTIANDYFELYGLPSVLMEGTNLVRFLKKFRLLLMDKGTNTVYRVKDLIGYDYTEVYTLLMVKQQVFKNGYPVYYTDTDGTLRPKQNIVFRRFGTADKNTSYFEYKNDPKTYTLEEITYGDPRWWDTPDVRQRINEMNYTLSNSKYIQLSTAVSMDDIWWQCCILLRGLLDHELETKSTKIGISQSLGSTFDVSLFDAVLVLIIIMNWANKDFQDKYFNGNLYLPNGTFNGMPACLDLLFNGLNPDGSPKEPILGDPYKVSSFNFNIRNINPEHYTKLYEYSYLEPDVFIPMLDRILNRDDMNIGQTIMANVKLLYKYLEKKLRTASTIYEFRQVSDAYNWLFLVDPIRNWSDRLGMTTNELIMTTYHLGNEEYRSFKSLFYGNMYRNSTIDVIYNDTFYAIPIYDILNKNVSTLDDFPFDDPGFLEAVNDVLDNWTNSTITSSMAISETIKANYVDMIRDKISLDLNWTNYGPKTFESLLYTSSPSLYRALMNIKNNDNQMFIMMRSIVRALEYYTKSPLPALEFRAVGKENYINVLKEVITYFKSYMVEFTKEEFVMIMGGLFDYGGNSNMLLLFDEIHKVRLRLIPREALHLYDVSCATVRLGVQDDISDFFYDEALFHIKTTYRQLKTIPYDIYYDYDEYVSSEPFSFLNDDDIIVANMIPKSDLELEIEKEYGSTNPVPYKIIITKNNINPNYQNYVGNEYYTGGYDS
jgi:hypothetical protein